MYTYIYICMFACMYVYMHMNVCAYIYINGYNVVDEDDSPVI